MIKIRAHVLRGDRHIKSCMISPMPIKPAIPFLQACTHPSSSTHSFCSGSEWFSSAEVVSVTQAVTAAGEELTKYFQAAIANSISCIQAPVDTMEQQAEHCQVEKMQRNGGNKRRKEGGRREGRKAIGEKQLQKRTKGKRRRGGRKKDIEQRRQGDGEGREMRGGGEGDRNGGEDKQDRKKGNKRRLGNKWEERVKENLGVAGESKRDLERGQAERRTWDKVGEAWVKEVEERGGGGGGCSSVTACSTEHCSSTSVCNSSYSEANKDDNIGALGSED